MSTENLDILLLCCSAFQLLYIEVVCICWHRICITFQELLSFHNMSSERSLLKCIFLTTSFTRNITTEQYYCLQNDSSLDVLQLKIILINCIIYIFIYWNHTRILTCHVSCVITMSCQNPERVNIKAFPTLLSKAIFITQSLYTSKHPTWTLSGVTSYVKTWN